MRLADYLDKGASLGAGAACLTVGESSLSYDQVQQLSWRIARALQRSGVGVGKRSRSCLLTTRLRSPAYSGAPAPAPSGAPSILGTRRLRITTCSISSTAAV